MQKDARTTQAQPGLRPLNPATALPRMASVNQNYWMSPNQPILPTAPKDQDVSPRQWDYPVGVNLQYLPRTEQQAGGLVFPVLRALADSYDVLRTCIEEKKDKILTMEWKIQMRDPEAEPDQARIDRLTALVACPDGRQSYGPWMRAILEDIIVCDATAVEPRFNVLDQLVALDYLDGTTFKILIDPQGRRPLPPDPSFQQIIKGQVAQNFTNDELFYYIRNPRTNRLYGMSYVEQIFLIINIALRHENRLLAEFTESNVPAAFMVMPDQINTKQIKEFSDWLDAKLSGNIAVRSKIIPIPGGGTAGEKIIPMKQYDLANPIMEWFARVVCFCLKIDPTPFLAQHTKATAEQSGDSANEIGLATDLKTVADFWNTIFAKYCNSPDIVFAFRTEAMVNAVNQSVADKNDASTGVVQIDEIRKRRGLEPLGLPLGFVTPTGYVLFPVPENQAALDAQQQQKTDAALAQAKAKGANQPQDPDDADSKAVAKAEALLEELLSDTVQKSKKKVLRSVADPKRVPQSHITDLTSTVHNFLASQAVKVAKQVARNFEDKATKGDDDISDADVSDMLDGVDLNWTFLVNPTKKQLDAVGQTGAKNALNDFGLTDAALFGEASAKVLKYAEDHSADLVTQISDSTRDMLKSTIKQALKDGTSGSGLKVLIQNSGAFDADRAKLIAQTELTAAYMGGNKAGWDSSGLTLEKQSLLSDDHDEEDECDDNAGAGWIDYEDAYPSGDDAPGFHPRCHCAQVVRTKEPVEVDQSSDDE